MSRMMILGAVAIAIGGLPSKILAQPWEDQLAPVIAAVQAGRYDDARELITPIEQACEPNAAGAPCRARVALEHGIINHSQARITEDVAGSLRLLQEAAALYRKAITENPSYGAAQQNLATVLGEIPASELDSLTLEVDSQRDPSRRGWYLRLQGDRLRAAMETRKAARFYQRALEAPGAGIAPVLALVELFVADSATISGDQLLEDLRRIENTDAGVAAAGYVTLIQKGHSKAPAVAQAALVRWVLLRAGSGGLDRSALAELPVGWEAAATATLEGFADGGCAFPDDWWDAESERRAALAELALARGRERLSSGDADGALECWAGAFHGANGPVALDLAREIAVVTHEHPELEDAQHEFQWVEDRLFAMKGSAIVSNDTAAEARLHTVLGLIYADRGIWGTPAEPRGAIYQLERAIVLGRRLDRRQRQHRPVPLLHTRLATAYSATARDSAAEQQLVEATRAYLDLDAVDSAQAIIGRLSRESRVIQDTLRPIIQLRQRISLALLAGADSTHDSICGRQALSIPLGGAFATAEAGSPREWTGTPFLARQRFKVLIDCVEIVSPRLRRLYAGEALRTIISTSEDRPLAGAADYARFERATQVAFEATTDSASGNYSLQQTGSRAQSRDSIAIAVGAETDEAVYILLPREALLTLRMLAVLNSLGLNVGFRVEENAVFLSAPVAPNILATTRRELRRLDAGAEIVAYSSPP